VCESVCVCVCVRERERERERKRECVYAHTRARVGGQSTNEACHTYTCMYVCDMPHSWTDVRAAVHIRD